MVLFVAERWLLLVSLRQDFDMPLNKKVKPVQQYKPLHTAILSVEAWVNIFELAGTRVQVIPWLFDYSKEGWDIYRIVFDNDGPQWSPTSPVYYPDE